MARGDKKPKKRARSRHKCRNCGYSKMFHNKNLRYDPVLYCPTNDGKGFKP